MAWTKFAVLADLPPGALREVERGNDRYALCNVGGEVRALAGDCPHQGGPLGEGALNGELMRARGICGSSIPARAFARLIPA